ncbi:MAG TPA: DUF4190 domain-containing protein [Streptosporangiaceae bacterium]|nr:DUF4190 domain-containing protein [Streptosporangiaceae bacterium]
MATNRWATPERRTAKTNPLAIAALVCGIIQFAGLIFPVAFVAIVLGHMARRKIRQTGEDGHGMAKAGLILGYIGLALTILFLLAVLAARAYLRLWVREGSYNW